MTSSSSKHMSLRRLLFSQVLMLTMLVATAVPALGETSNGTTLEIPMQVTAFDETVARAAGNEIVVAEDGTQVLRDVETKEAVATIPAEGSGLAQGELVGDCGMSYVYLDDDPDPAAYNITTGFRVNDPAISYHWLVQVTGPSMLDEYEYGGGLASRKEWDGIGRGDVISRGESHVAEVVPSESWALLYWGGICTSLGPSAGAIIY